MHLFYSLSRDPYLTPSADAFHYFWSYTHYLDFDNIYITYLFETVDTHRRTKRMEHVLPIKSFEKDTYVSPYTILMTRSEKTRFYNSNAILLYEVSIVYIFISVLKIHATQAAQSEVTRSVRAVQSFLQDGAMDVFRKSELLCRLGFINYFSVIYATIFFLAFHSVWSTRFRAVVCGLVYPEIEESRAMALYHTILVQRQDLFDIRYALLMDRLAHEETKAEFLFRFRWWQRLSGAYLAVVKYLHARIVARVYEYCALCGDYGKAFEVEWRGGS